MKLIIWNTKKWLLKKLRGYSEIFEFFQHKEMTKLDGTDHCFIARCRPLGLTAYGDTQNEANEKLVRMFESLMLINFKYRK